MRTFAAGIAFISGGEVIAVHLREGTAILVLLSCAGTMLPSTLTAQDSLGSIALFDHARRSDKKSAIIREYGFAMFFAGH